MKYGAILIVALLFGGLFTSGLLSESNDGLATLANSLIPENNSNESNASELNLPSNPPNSEGNNQVVFSEQAPENWETVDTDSGKNDDVITEKNIASTNINSNEEINLEIFEQKDEKFTLPLKSELGGDNKNTNPQLLPIDRGELGGENRTNNPPLLSTIPGDLETNNRDTNPPYFKYDEDLNDSKNANTHTQKVPEPTSGFFSLAVAGLATAYLKKK